MKMMFAMALAGATLLATPSTAATLVQYDFTGAAGNQTSTAATNVANGLTGISFTRGSGLTATTAVGSLNSSGFTGETTDFLSFGLNVMSGFSGSVNQILIGTRSSGTGPGFLNLLASVDNGAFMPITSFAQPATNDFYQNITFSPLTASSSIIFRLAAASQISANGGTVGTGGTFRVENYVAGTSNTPVSINGSVMSLASAVPEPATWGMMIVGLGVVGCTMRRRQKVRATVTFA